MITKSCSSIVHQTKGQLESFFTAARPVFPPDKRETGEETICAPDAVAKPRFENPIKARDGAGTVLEGTARGAAVRRTDRGVARGSIVRNMTAEGKRPENKTRSGEQ